MGQCPHWPFFDRRPIPLVHSASVNHTAPSGPTTRAYGVPPGLGMGSSRNRVANWLGVGVGTTRGLDEGVGLKAGPTLGEPTTIGVGPGLPTPRATGKCQWGRPAMLTMRTSSSIAPAPTRPETILVCMAYRI